MNLEKLIYMANQIATFFAHEGAAQAQASIVDHLQKFWDPRMRAEICAAVAQDRAAGLEPLALAAIWQLAGSKPKR
jgi:formate dehydrogenase subunit delta